MTKTIRMQAYYRWLFTIAIVCALPLFIGALGLFWSDDPQAWGFAGKREQLIAAGLFSAFTGLLLAGSVYSLIASLVERVTFADGVLTVRSVTQNFSSPLEAIELVQWRRFPGYSGAIKLRTNTNRARIHLDNYSAADRLSIIRAIRSQTVAAVQDGWPRYCREVALPLRDGRAAVEKFLAPETRTVTITRSYYDRTWLRAAVIMLFPAMLPCGWPLAIVSLLAFIGWAFLRFTTPVEGREEISLASNARGRLITACALLMIVPTISIIMLKLLNLFYPVLGVLFLLLGYVLYRGYRLDRERKQRSEELAEALLSMWNAGEPIKS